ncbi:MAG: NADAR domain-containing protein [Candidatus Sericytochromatia bacterium]
MLNACYSKFPPNYLLRKNLIETENKILVDVSPYDKIWGIGLDENNPKILEPNNWKGLNLLG